MNNFMIGFKRFITNKNVITIIGVILILVILYFGYSSSIKSKTNPVSVPVASHEIGSKTEITASDVVYKQVAQSMLDANVIRNSRDVIGKYTNINVTVPEGSPFYNAWLTDAKNIPGNWIESLNHEKGELGYYMSVSVESTLGNSVLPDTYIDIYMKAQDESGRPMFGKLLKNVKVLVVHDGMGRDIFRQASEVGSPSKIGFAVSPDVYILLHKAEYLDIDLILAPRGSITPTKDEIVVTSAVLRDYIDAKAETVVEDVIEEEPVSEETTTNQDANTNNNVG